MIFAANRRTTIAAMLCALAMPSTAAGELSRTGCPFSAGDGTEQTLLAQVQAISINPVPSADPAKNAKCETLVKGFNEAKKAYSTSMSDERLGGDAKMTETEQKERLALAEATENLMDGGCEFTDSNGAFANFSLGLLNSLAGTASALGVVNPVGFVAGFSLSIASRLGVTVAAWFKRTSNAQANIKGMVEGNAFEERLCKFRQLAYKLDEIDPENNALESRIRSRESDLSEIKKSINKAEFSCDKQNEFKVEGLDALVKAAKSALVALKESDPELKRLRCFGLLESLTQLKGRISGLADPLTCAAAKPGTKTHALCQEWPALLERINASPPSELCSVRSASEFTDSAATALGLSHQVAAEQIDSLKSSPSNTYAEYVRQKDRARDLEIELKNLRVLAQLNSPEALQKRREAVAKVGEMLSNVGEILLETDFTKYYDFHHNREDQAIGTILQDLKSARGKSPNTEEGRKACQGLNRAKVLYTNHFAAGGILGGRTAAICNALIGESGSANPPFHASFRNFTSIIGKTKANFEATCGKFNTWRQNRATEIEKSTGGNGLSSDIEALRNTLSCGKK